MSGPTRNNKKGMFENTEIRNEIIKPYLISIGADPLGQFPLPRQQLVVSDDTLSIKVLNTLSTQGMSDNERWFYKGAKMTLIWKLWHSAFPQAQWLIVRRPDKEIIDSCLRTNFMKAYKDSSGWQKWVDYHKKCWTEMQNAGLNLREIWTDKIIAGDYSELKEVLIWLGFNYNSELLVKIKNFVDPKLTEVCNGC